MAITKKKPVNYVDNKEFQAAMKVFIYKCREEKAAGRPRPKIPDYIGECIYKIAKGLSTKYNFANYSYIDDMVGDGLENVFTYIDRFDPDHPKANAFSYVTQTVWFAFLRRIEKEKKQSYIKNKLLEKIVIFDQAVDVAGGDFRVGSDQNLTDYNVYENIEAFETSKAKKNKKRKAKEEPAPEGS